MKRDIEADLLAWKTQTTRSPLLVRGARQVGKTYVIETFGQNHFDHFVSINFDQHPQYAQCFEALDPLKIVSAIEILSGKSISPGKTLLFLDEIQECPRAIMALRYFKEQMPDLHVVAAGSLLEFVLNDENFRMPVGRVQFLYLKPMSFYEFLTAMGHDNLRRHLASVTLKNPPTEAIHDQSLALMREYVALGGMPEVVRTYVEVKSLKQCQNKQSDLLTAFRNDFGKYAKQTQHKHLQLLFDRAPGLIAQSFKYSSVEQNVPSRDLRMALDKLCNAGILYRIHATSCSGIPLISTLNEKKFKLLFLDVGLVKRAQHLDLDLLFKEDIMLINRGSLAEQLVGQELLAYFDRHELAQLFYWQRDQAGSSAEVDYVIALGTQIIPIEVKAGATGKLKSMQILMREKQLPVGVRISQKPLALDGQVLSLPLYMISELARLVQN